MVKLNPQPAGTRVDWSALNGDPSVVDVKDVDANLPFEFNVGCTADTFSSIKGAIQVVSNVHSACNADDTALQSTLISVEQPSALVGSGGTIRAGESFRIPVYLTGVGSWHLKWSDGFEEDVTTLNPFRPAFHARTVSPQQSTNYFITEVTTTGCGGAENGDEFGSAAINVIQGPAKATPLIFVNDVVINAGGQARFTARLALAGGGNVEGARLDFKVFDKSLGSGTTDKNGIASVVGTVDFPPDVYGSVIKVSFAETDAIKAGSGTGNLTIICDVGAFTVQPDALNVLGDRETRQNIVVRTSANCTYTPTVNPEAQSWLHVDPSTKQTGTQTLTVVADKVTEPLPGGTRTGFIFIGQRSVSVQQTQVCTYRFNPSIAYLPADPAFGSFTTMSVSTAEGCPWTVTADQPWLHLDEFSGVGPGTVRFHVDQNNGANAIARTAKLEFDKGGSGSVNQYAPGPCVEPHLEIDARGGSVKNGAHAIAAPIFSGTNLGYTIYFQGIPAVNTGLGQVIIPRWHSWYPTPGHPSSFMVLAKNECGAALSSNVTWTNDTEPGDSCLVPNVRDHPGSVDSPRPGASVPLGV